MRVVCSCGALHPKGTRCGCRPSPARRPTVARGYGPEHRALRRQWAPDVEAGEVDCHATVCLEPDRRIEPGTPWSLGHTADRTDWTGPEHSVCGSADGGRRAHRTWGLVEVVRMVPVTVPFPVDAEHPPADFDG